MSMSISLFSSLRVWMNNFLNLSIGSNIKGPKQGLGTGASLRDTAGGKYWQ